MKQIALVFFITGIAAAGCLVVGLYKPWIVLWWRDHQTRRMVIALYSKIIFVCFLIYWGMRIFL